MNIIAKIFALPVKLLNIVCKVLLVLAPVTRIIGLLLTVVFTVFTLILPFLVDKLNGVSQPIIDWEVFLASVKTPLIITFAELPFLVLETLSASLFKWLWYEDHRSTKAQIYDYICEKRYNDAVNSSTSHEDTEKKIRELEKTLIEIHNRGGR